MNVKFKKYHCDAKLPRKAYDKDFCYDVYAVSEEEIAPNVWKYGLGFGLQVERGLETITNYLTFGGYEPDFALDFENSPIGVSVDLRPRSSVWKTGMVLSNSTGTIDEGYCNEISAVFYHVLPNMPRYKVGDKIAQIKLGTALPINFINVDEFEETERGMRGYGSSGK